MRLTTKGRYAVTAMIDLSINQEKGPVTLKSISDNQRISLAYLEQLFAKMRRAELVCGTPGPGGGYLLAKDVDRISIADIVVAVDEPLNVTECAGRQDCHQGKRCLTHGLWSELSEQLYGFLDGIPLGQLMRESGLVAGDEPMHLGGKLVEAPIMDNARMGNTQIGNTKIDSTKIDSTKMGSMAGKRTALSGAKLGLN